MKNDDTNRYALMVLTEKNFYALSNMKKEFDFAVVIYNNQTKELIRQYNSSSIPRS